MAVIFGGDVGIQQDSFGNFIDEIKSEFSRVADGFAGKITNIAEKLPKENVYVDDGFMNVPGTSFAGSAIENFDDVKKRRITTQKPDITVYVKKKLFWSLRNEHDSKYMDSGEKLFLRASKLLFERKCTQIAAYESMTKVSALLDEEADLDYAQIETIADFADNSAGAFLDAAQSELDNIIQNIRSGRIVSSAVINAAQINLESIKSDSAKIGHAIESLRKLAKNAKKTKSATTTSWVIDPEKNIDLAGIGRGVGVIELTMVDSLNTALNIEYGDVGSISMSIEDPYNIMKITADDIELALRSAYRELDHLNFTQDSSPAQFILDAAREKDEQLKKLRSNRLGIDTFVGMTPDIGEITFEINVSSFAPYNVTGRVPALNETFNSGNYNILLSQLPVSQRLTQSETVLVKQIFDLLEDYVKRIIMISETSKANDKDDNVKYARRQLRLFYLGKNIIQPMDGLNIYIRSRTFNDSELIGPLNYYLNGSSFVRSFSDNSEASDAVLQEEMRQFGLDNAGISIELYRTLRTGSLLRNAGTHVFGGLVSAVSESYSAASGKYVLSVSGESNMKWLKMSRVNTSPSLDQPQGLLEDPLTPLDLKIDQATGLIIGEPSLSSENIKKAQAGDLVYNSGIYKGFPLDEKNIGQDIIVYGSNVFKRLTHAPGLVYKWKQGIITATRNINLRTRLNGERSEIDKLRREVGVNVTVNPFANLDVADVLSLVVTGFPHNYESFFINAQTVGTFTPDVATNSPESYFHSFFDITQSTNRALGNFQPFKSINIDRAQMVERLKLQTDLSRDNQNIKHLQSEIAKLQDRMSAESAFNEESDKTNLQSILRSKVIESLKPQIEKLKTSLIDEKNNFIKKIGDSKDLGFRIYGDDITLELADETEPSSGKKLGESMKKIKTRSKLMQMRPQLNTKFNTDVNLFVVSDDYDKDLDLQAFIVALSSGEIPIWNSSYQEPLDICINAAKVIDFEFFTDSQGNIQFRPPKYNKVPLSLLAKMMLLSENGLDIFPPFLKSLFLSRKESLEKSRDALNLEIKINSLLLFKRVLSDSEAFGRRHESLDLFLNSVVDVGATSSGNVNDIISSVRSFRNELFDLTGEQHSPDTEDENKRIAKEINELHGLDAPNKNAKRLDKLNKILQLFASRERVQETLNKLGSRQTKEKQYNDLLDGTRSSGNSLSVSEMSSLLEPFGDLIEDDYNDFLGPGSAARFIIYDDKIIEYRFDESDRNVQCRVDVTGQEDLLGGNPGEIGGIPLIWAGATDFDLWKQYGYRAGGSSTNKPFFKDAETQCAPYALMLLSRQRRDVVRATLTIAGNEYYQLGDVVYVNSRDLLYYVYGVRHKFSYNSGQFTTELDLRYGHPLGEFIPTPLDVIGKNLIKNQRKFNTTFMFRQDSDKNIGRLSGVVVFKNNMSAPGLDDLKKMMLEGDLGAHNLSELKNCLLRINSQSGGDIKVDIRGFKKSEEEGARVLQRMEVIKDWLTNPISGFNQNGDEITLDRNFYSPIQKDMIYDFDEDGKGVVDLKDPGEANKGRSRPMDKTQSLASSATSLEYFIEVIIEFLD